jgi:phosphatidylglycerophosphatase A
MSDGINPNRPRAPLWAKLVATFFGTGLLRPGPGSWGSAATVLLWWLLSHCMPMVWQPYAAGSLAVIAVLIGIPAATLVARASGLKDPQFVVIDEVAGQLITQCSSRVMAISTARIYTFSWVRYRKTSSGAPTGTTSRGCGHRNR